MSFHEIVLKRNILKLKNASVNSLNYIFQIWKNVVTCYAKIFSQKQKNCHNNVIKCENTIKILEL